MTRKALFVVPSIGVLFIIACGGGGSNSNNSPASPAITAVSVSCIPASVQTNQTSQCSATVTGTGNYSSAVTWSATDGTVTAAGVFTPSGSGTAMITATSTEDTTKFGSGPVTVTVAQASCAITGSGAIQSDGSLGGNPLLGDVYQIEGTITANYVDDDEVSDSTLVVTSPDGNHTVTSGLFLLTAHANGLNTFAARVAAGYESKGVWVPGTWAWKMNLQDRAGNACTETGSYTVSPTFDNANGFLRQYLSTPNLVTDGNNQAFWPTGVQLYGEYYNGSNEVYNVAEIPASVFVNVNGTDVAYVSGTNFTTQTLPPGVYNQITICPNGVGTPAAAGSCTQYWNVTINSSTDITLPPNGGTYSNVQAYLGFIRDLHVGTRPQGYQSSLTAAAQFYSQWGNNFSRFPDSQLNIEIIENFLATGYNDYNYNNTTGTTWGAPAVDLWFAAAHAAGIHLMLGGPWGPISTEPCSTFVCTPTEISNLQHFYAMIANRWGAFYDILELSNEREDVPQAWVDYAGAVISSGVSGINGGNPADPYGHFFTNSYFPNNPQFYTTTYGPFSTGPSDQYLNLIDLPHSDSVTGQVMYHWLSGQLAFADGCPASAGYGGATLPRFNGEEGTQLGIAPSLQTPSAPSDEVNGPRIVDESMVLNQCGGAIFSTFWDIMAMNSSTPIVANSWYDDTLGRYLLQSFMKNLDAAASPLAVTLGGGCAANNCSYSALGSSSHVRIVLNSSTGNAGTGVPNSVNGGTVTFSVPHPNMTGKWWNTANGSIISTVTTAATAGTQTFTAPNFNVDMWFQLD